jgi:hypothetical protein
MPTRYGDGYVSATRVGAERSMRPTSAARRVRIS